VATGREEIPYRGLPGTSQGPLPPGGESWDEAKDYVAPYSDNVIKPETKDFGAIKSEGPKVQESPITKDLKVLRYEEPKVLKSSPPTKDPKVLESAAPVILAVRFILAEDEFATHRSPDEPSGRAGQTYWRAASWRCNQSSGTSLKICSISAFFLGFKETCNSLVDGFPNKRPSEIKSFAMSLASPIWWLGNPFDTRSMLVCDAPHLPRRCSLLRI